MVEYTANTLQEVNSNQNVLFSDTIASRTCAIIHRNNSGLFTLRSYACQNNTTYKATFNANIAIPDDGTVEAISLAFTLSGEVILPTTMIVTPAAATEFFNVSSSVYIDVPGGCCSQMSITNTSSQAIDVQNANLIIEKVRGF